MTPTLYHIKAHISITIFAYSEINRLDNDRIKADFRALYQAMNTMTLQEMDPIPDPVCTLCRDHERTGLIAGVRIGIQLNYELSE